MIMGSTCQKMKISNKKKLKLPILRKNLKKNKMIIKLWKLILNVIWYGIYDIIVVVACSSNI